MEAYRLSWKFIFPAVLRILRNREEAEDIMQESYVKGFMRLKDLRDPSSYPAWQKQIAVRNALNRLRQLRPEISLQPGMDELKEEVGNGWDQLDPALLEKELERLPDGYRIVIQLYVMDNLSHEEIGEALGIKASSARSQYSRALHKLKQQVLTTYANT